MPAPSGPQPHRVSHLSIAFHEPPLGTEAQHPAGTLALPSASEGFNIVCCLPRGDGGEDSFLLSNKVIRKDGHSRAALVNTGQDALSPPPPPSLHVAHGGFCIFHPISSACFEPTLGAARVMRF